MKKYLLVNGSNISVQLNIHAIIIYNDNELTALLKQNAKAATDELVQLIKSGYIKLFNEDFKVSNASIAVEIWAHVYVEKFAKAIKSFISVKLFNKVLDKIIYHCQEINIGEKGHDNNRFVWDLLAPFKFVIEWLLFK